MMPPTSNKDLASVGEDAAVEEGLPPPQEKAFDNDGDGAANGKSTKGNRLSVTSEKYDREGKGFLDDAQARMREMDTSNRGYITNDRVYNMMKEQLGMQKQMVTQKRLIIGLLIFSVVLALANMGTAFAAAILAKDTTVDGASGAMVSTADGKTVGTMSQKEVYSGAKNVEKSRRILINEYDGTKSSDDYEIRVAETVAISMWSENCGGKNPQQQTDLVLIVDCTPTNTGDQDLSVTLSCRQFHSGTNTYKFWDAGRNEIRIKCGADSITTVDGVVYCLVSGMSCCGSSTFCYGTDECCDPYCGKCDAPGVFCIQGCAGGGDTA